MGGSNKNCHSAYTCDNFVTKDCNFNDNLKFNTTESPHKPIHNNDDRVTYLINNSSNNNNHPPADQLVAIADTGASGNYIAHKDISILDNIKVATSPISVILPDGSTITSSHTAEIVFDNIQPLIAHIFPNMTTSLISIGSLCDIGLTATFHKEKVNIYYNSNSDKIVITGERDAKTGLWMINLPHKVANTAANALTQHCNSEQFVQLVHLSWGSPAPSTFINAITKGYIKVKGLTANIVRKYIHTLVTLPSAKGHLDQHRQGIMSTKTYIAQNKNNKSCNNKVQVKIIDVPQRNTDITGQFPIPSKAGHLYHMVMFCKVSNYIHTH
jgi:hypothetical protein